MKRAKKSKNINVPCTVNGKIPKTTNEITADGGMENVNT